MTSWTIGRKLMAGSGVMVALILALSYFSFRSISSLGTVVAAGTAEKMDRVGALRLQLQAMITHVKANQLSYIATHISQLEGHKGNASASDMQCSACHSMGRSEETRREFETMAGRAGEQIAALRASIPDENGQARLKALETGIAAWRQHYQEFLSRIDENNYEAAHDLVRDKMSPILQEVDKAAQELADQQRAFMASSGADARHIVIRSRWMAMLLVGLSLAAGASVPFLVRGVNHVLRRAVADLRTGAEQVNSAAAEVSTSSQSVAQGASQQAASLEQTSASSLELGSVTRKNAEHSRSAADFTGQATQIVDTANRHLEQMVASMQAITASSDKISKIIKVIDEIAFQTNILALNAAVEAARAGESGAGFAVVADEVRNLAARCAQAAQDTSSLIEDSIARSTDGKAKLDLVAAAVQDITSHVAQIKGLVDQVNLGSEDQAQRIEQISKAISEMDHVTQTAAASAEESASAGEELHAQAASLSEIVSRLTTLVGRA
jgi:methyl-accepting chemotaxis protein/methyl-accepting chemotaxis protein-1 (serine sensor receptor)